MLMEHITSSRGLVRLMMVIVEENNSLKLSLNNRSPLSIVNLRKRISNRNTEFKSIRFRKMRAAKCRRANLIRCKELKALSIRRVVALSVDEGVEMVYYCKICTELTPINVRKIRSAGRLKSLLNWTILDKVRKKSKEHWVVIRQRHKLSLNQKFWKQEAVNWSHMHVLLAIGVSILSTDSLSTNRILAMLKSVLVKIVGCFFKMTAISKPIWKFQATWSYLKPFKITKWKSIKPLINK